MKSVAVHLTSRLICSEHCGTGFIMPLSFLQIQQNSTGMDTEICHVMLAGHIYKLLFMLLCFGHRLNAISSHMSLMEKQSAVVCSNKTTTWPAGVAIFKYHVDLIHQVESFLYFLLFFCLVASTSVIYSDLLPHAIIVRAQYWPDQAEDCRMCYWFFRSALHVFTEWSSVVA